MIPFTDIPKPPLIRRQFVVFLAMIAALSVLMGIATTARWYVALGSFIAGAIPGCLGEWRLYKLRKITAALLVRRDGLLDQYVVVQALKETPKEHRN